MRNVAEVLRSIKNNLLSLNSPLAEFKDYSNIYIIFRSIANLLVEQSSQLEEEKDQNFLSKASGFELDRFGLLYGKVRDEGQYARGFVLAKSTSKSQELEAGIILTTADGNSQFTLEQDIVLRDNLELPISVKSTVRTSESNLPSGTRLYSSFYNDVEFIVGKYRNNLSTPVIGLTGGKLAENDLLFKDRLILHLSNLEKGTLNAIRSEVLSQGLTKVFILEQVPVTGYITIYVNTTNQEKINSLYTFVDEVKPAGLAYNIEPVKYVTVDLNINIRVVTGSDIDNTIAQIRTEIYESVDNLEMGESLSMSLLLSLVLNVSGVSTANVTNPNDNILVNFDELVNIRNIFINTFG